MQNLIMQNLIIFLLAFLVGRLGTLWYLKRQNSKEWRAVGDLPPHVRPPRELSHFDGRKR